MDLVLARLTVAEWCGMWLAAYSSHRPSTVRQARTHIQRIEGRFGSQRLMDIRPSEIKQWTAELSEEGLKDSTVYSIYRRFAQIL